jgi:hypothetical protein
MTYKKYCTYKTSHPDGFYYLGKGQTERILTGEYLGSGSKLNAAFCHQDYSRDSWTIEIIKTYDNENDAYNDEQRILTDRVLSDPFCLNQAGGGTNSKPLSLKLRDNEFTLSEWFTPENSNIIIGDITIKMDKSGRYSLNDLHQASGGQEKDRPALWLRSAQAQGLIDAIVDSKEDCTTTDSSYTDLYKVNPVNTIYKVGTFACKEMVYAYAMWLNPAFHLRVIRAFDSLYTTRPAPATQSVERLLLSAIEIGQSLGIEPRYAVRSVRKEILDATGVDISRMTRYMK